MISLAAKSASISGRPEELELSPGSLLAGLPAADDKIVTILGPLERLHDHIVRFYGEVRVLLGQRPLVVRLDQGYRSLVEFCRVPHGPRLPPAVRVRQQRVGKTLDPLVHERVGFVGLWHERVVVGVDRATQHGQADLLVSYIEAVLPVVQDAQAVGLSRLRAMPESSIPPCPGCSAPSTSRSMLP